MLLIPETMHLWDSNLGCVYSPAAYEGTLNNKILPVVPASAAWEDFFNHVKTAIYLLDLMMLEKTRDNLLYTHKNKFLTKCYTLQNYSSS